MEYKEPEMSLINRPDERRREEARIARASLARPLIEPETQQVYQGDSTFSRVSVPNSQLDEFTKDVMAVLGPYHSVLGGPTINGPRPARVFVLSKAGNQGGGVDRTAAVAADAECDNTAVASVPPSNSGIQKPQPYNKQHANSTAPSRPSGSSSVGGDKKRPTSLPLSQLQSTSSTSSSITPSKTAKPSLLTHVDSSSSSRLSSSSLPPSSTLPSVISSSIQSSSTYPLDVPSSIPSSSLTTFTSTVSSSLPSSTHTSAVSLYSSSSPVISSQSPVKPLIPKVIPKDYLGNKEERPKPKSWTSHAPSSFKQRIPSSSSLKSPKKNVHQPQKTVPPSSSIFSKPKPPSSSTQTNSSSSSSVITEDRSQHSSPPPLQDTLTLSSTLRSSKDYNSNTTTSTVSSLSIQTPATLTTTTTTTSQPSRALSSVSISSLPHVSPSSSQTAVEPSPPSRPQSSYSNRTHVAQIPRPRSTTPTKTKPHTMNGITSQHQKISSAISSALLTEDSSISNNTSKTKLANSTQSSSMASSSSEKSKSLSLWIPNEKKMSATKSDLIDILKEMTELHAPLTAIETPQKADGQFPFHTSRPLDRQVVQLSNELTNGKIQDDHINTSELKTEITKEIKKEVTPQKEEKPTMPVLLSSSPNTHTDDDTKETKVEPETEHKFDLTEKLSHLNDVVETGRCSSRSSSLSHTSRYRSMGKNLPDDNSILIRDLDLSEDSDVDTAPEEMNLSESQSKKGKVITASGEALNSRVEMHTSSSSSHSSTSNSSSESDGDDDDDDDNDDNDHINRTNKMHLDKSSDRRSSSSSCSSSSSSEQESDEDDDDDGHKIDSVENSKNAIERREKTPSPNSKQGSTPTAVSQENAESGVSWCLEHFMQPRRNFGSPASVSPYKSVSPPMSQSVPVPVSNNKEESQTTDNRSRTLRDMGQCGTMSFELQSQKVTDYDRDDNLADGEDENQDESVNFKRKTKITNSSEKTSETSPVKKFSDQLKHSDLHKRAPRMAADNNKNIITKEAQVHASALPTDRRSGDVQKKVLVSTKHISSSSSNDTNDRKKTPSPVSVANSDKLTIQSPVAKTKLAPPSLSSSSNDEIDVVSFTPDDRSHHRRISSSDKTLSNKRGILELSKKLFNGALSESSDDDSKTSKSRDKNIDLKNIKRYKRTGHFGENSSSISPKPLSLSKTSNDTFTSSPSGASIKTFKKDNVVTLDHLEAISKPPNLLLPAHSNYSSPPVGSTKPLPPFQTSFSPLHSSTCVMPPYVTLTRCSDGTSRPKIVVQIPHSFLSKKVFSWVKDKRERRKKSLRDVIVPEPPKLESPAESTRSESRVPSISDSKPFYKTSSNNVKNSDASNSYKNGEKTAPTNISSSTAHSSSTKPSLKPDKYQSRDGGSSSGFDNGSVFSNHNKTPSKSSSKETHSSIYTSSERKPPSYPGRSSSSVDLPTSAVSNGTASSLQTKSTNSTSSSPQTVPSRINGVSAVKNLNFSEGIDLNADISKSDKLKQFKRKLDTVDDSSKRSKSDNVIEKVSNPTPASVSKRRDSTNSTSSKGSHQSSKSSHQSSKSRHMSISNKKNINGNNNNLDNTNAELTNGPENTSLPFNHYVNSNVSGSSNNDVVNTRAPSSMSTNIPPPSPIETQLHPTQHYLARATEHKHHADNLRDKPAKYEPYLRAGLSFFLAGYTMELSKREQTTTSYNMFNDTSNLLQYVIRMRANSSSNPESSDKERKLIVFIIRLQSYLNHRMYRLKGAEVIKLKRAIEMEQAKHQSTTAGATSSSSSSNNNTTVSSKPHAPSPHQTNWNKNSTGTPSPMSPTPSPAGSVSSQGSCELVPGKIQNGNTSSSSTPLTSPSPGMVSVNQRVHAVTQKYFILTSHMVKALELWDQADAESKGFEKLFTELDMACGPLTFHSDPPVIVRYMKYALRLLHLGY